MHSDASGCVQMRLDTFGKIRRILTKKNSFARRAPKRKKKFDENLYGIEVRREANWDRAPSSAGQPHRRSCGCRSCTSGAAPAAGRPAQPRDAGMPDLMPQRISGPVSLIVLRAIAILK